MKKTLITTYILFSSSLLHAVEPFGLKVGVSLKDVEKKSGVSESIGYDNYSFKNVPDRNDEFKSYLMLITPKNGLCRITGWGKPIITNDNGDELKKRYSSLKTILIEKYGEPEVDKDLLTTDSHLNKPNEWTKSLYKMERNVESTWKLNESNGVQNIILIANANEINSGKLTLVYELSNSEECFTELKSKEMNSFL